MQSRTACPQLFVASRGRLLCVVNASPDQPDGNAEGLRSILCLSQETSEKQNF